MFSVIDTNGNVKVKSGGTGSNLPDPLTVPHGGIGLESYNKSEMIYGLSANTYANLLVDNDLGQTAWKVMFNGGSVLADGTILNDNGPRWGKLYGSGIGSNSFYDRMGAFLNTKARAFMCETFLGTAANTISTVAWSTGVAGTQSLVTDSTTVWNRLTTAAADVSNVAGFQPSAFSQANPSPYMVAKFRTGSDITNTRFYFGLVNAVLSGNTDDFSGNFGVGIRYSTVATDPGFVFFSLDGTTQVIGPTAIASISPSTVYTVELALNSTNVNGCSVSVNGVSQSFTPPGNIVGRTLVATLGVKSTDNTNTKFIDISAIYASCNY